MKQQEVRVDKTGQRCEASKTCPLTVWSHRAFGRLSEKGRVEIIKVVLGLPWRSSG